MSLYADHILPRCVAWVLAAERYTEQRLAALEPAAGRVLELGFGAGLNLPCYPAAVTELLALEPAHVNRKLARKRIAGAPFPVEWVGLRGEEIPLDAASVDCVTSTWTFCTIPDVARALAEVRRVLRPGGKLVFLEHGLAPDPRIARRQDRCNGLMRLFAGGCNLNRVPDRSLRAEGFVIESLDHPILKGPTLVSYSYRGVAVPG